jgi:vacuolar-type H+-ATPase subunit E/Vma4
MTDSGLVTELRRRAEASAESILSAARDEAERIGAEAERTIEERRSVALSGREAEYRARARGEVAAARHEAMRDVLVARTRAVERVLERVRALLHEASQQERYLSNLADELIEALRFVDIDGEGVAVRCAPELEQAVRDALRDEAAVAVEANPEIGAGFTVVGSGGTVVVDGRLEARVQRLAPTLAIEINAELEERLQ